MKTKLFSDIYIEISDSLNSLESFVSNHEFHDKSATLRCIAFLEVLVKKLQYIISYLKTSSVIYNHE